MRTPGRHIVFEACTDSIAGVIAAHAGGADRVELCSDLFEGGLTPSYGLIKCAKGCLDKCKLHVLIRPRPGDFHYTDHELQVMKADVAAAADLGADGVVIGCLNIDGTVNRPQTQELLAVARAKGMAVTFHRAFDMCKDLRSSLQDIMDLGIERVLTSGGAPSASKGAEVIKELVQQAAGRIQVMAGGGVTESNVGSLIAATGVSELHGSARRPQQSSMEFRKTEMSLTSAKPPPDYEQLVTDCQAVKAIIANAAAACLSLPAGQP